MTTVIEVGNSEGSRRCDAKCYDAKGSECECICGGANHGAGYLGAIENNRRRFGVEIVDPNLPLPRVERADEPLF